MLNLIKVNTNKILVANILFCLFPLSLIAGNLFINLNLIFLILTTFFFYFSKFKDFKLNLLDKIITFFFIYIFLTLVVNYFEYFLNNKEFPFEIINKTFLYLRYYLLYVSLRVLTHYDILKLKWFYISASFFVIFLCIDIFIQYFFLKDILGNVPITERRMSGFFGDELIAGGYIQRLSFFAIFLPFILNTKKNLNKYLIFFIIIILIFGVILSGNKMPFFLFLLSLSLFCILNVNLRKKFLILFLFAILFLSLIYKTNTNFKNDIGRFYNTAVNVINVFTSKSNPLEGNKNMLNAPYILEFYGAYITWKKNIFFGGGIKSFRYNCPNCNSHPHNYYLEFFVDLGLLGFFIVSFFLFCVFSKIYKLRHIFNFNSMLDYKTFTFFIIFFIEFFPIRSSGSFFSTGNAAFIFLILALLVSLMEKSEHKRIS